MQFISNRYSRGFEYHWLNLGPMIGTPAPDTDLEAIEQGYVAVSPLNLDLTHYVSMERLKKLYEN